jgi:nucleoside-triphosphatase
MTNPAKNLLLTGPPGCGKTTVVCRAAGLLRGRRLAGFFTREMRQQGKRVGFEAAGLGGGRIVLAHTDIRGRHRVGRYGVDIAALEAIVRAELCIDANEVDVFIIDEIGKMECCSDFFIAAAGRILAGPTPVLATIAAKGGGLISGVKARRDVQLLTVTPDNRDNLADELVRTLAI